MKIALITSRSSGLPILFLERLEKNPQLELAGIIYSEGLITNKKKYLIKKFSKMLKVGLSILISGFYLRNIFNEESNLKMNENLFEWASKRNYHITRIKKTISPLESDLIKIRELNFDVGISIGNSFISPKILKLAKKRFINIHHEVLPEYTGAQPIVWQLYNGNNKSGFTLHEMNSKIDEGTILYQESHQIKFHDSFKATIQQNTADIKSKSIKALINLLVEDSPVDFNLNNRIRTHYTTPNLSQLIRIIKNYKLLKKNELIS